MIPEWLKEVDAKPSPPAGMIKGKKSFIRKTLEGIFAFFQESLVSESISAKKGLLQSLDPRFKLVSILMLVFSLSLTRDIRILLAVYLLELALSYASRIELLFFLKRVWLFIPVFTGVIALPLIFNIFLPGDPLFQVAWFGENAHLGPIPLPESIYVTRQGVSLAAVFTLRVAVSVSAVVLLFLSTPQQVLFKSLRSVGVPKLYVLTLEMAYRYIFLLTDLVKDIYLAKRARTIRPGSTREEQRWVGGRIGYILMRSMSTSEKVHMAMLSRGFDGEVKILQRFRAGRRDYMSGLFALSLSLLLVLVSQNIIRI
jgi:cobalt/nickel transport system permease protein